MRCPVLLFVLLFTSHVYAQFSPVAVPPGQGLKRNVATAKQADFFQSPLMEKYNARHLKLDIELEPNNRAISGWCKYVLDIQQALDSLAIELVDDLVLDSLKINGSIMPFSRRQDHVFIPLKKVWDPPHVIEVVFYYRGTMGKGIYAGADETTGLRYTASVSEAFQAREWFPAKQILNDKIDSAEIFITTGREYLAASNGLLKAVVELPGNKRQFQWKTNYPMAYYLPFFAVGNYKDYSIYAKPSALKGDSLLIQNFIVDNPDYFDIVKENIDKTPALLEKMSQLFGLYPFVKEKYGHAHANIGGGMEHQTMSTMHTFADWLIAHELAHQWFGDNVTCASWRDIWLNEGFAHYSLVLMMEYLPHLFNVSREKQLSDVENDILTSSPTGSVYIPAEQVYDEARIFDGHLSYNKGSFAIHTLRFEMQNDSLFFKTLQLYQTRFKDSFATTADFKQLAEEVTGRDFTQFFKQWIYGEGYPIYSVTYGKLNSDTLLMKVDQATTSPVTPFFDGRVEYKIFFPDGDTVVTFSQIANSQIFKIRFNKKVDSISVDPNNWLVNKTGSIVTSLPPEPDVNQAGVKIFPNPSHGIVNVHFSNFAFSTFKLVDVEGRVLKNTVIPAGSDRFQTRLNIPGGLYFIKLRGKKGSSIHQLLVEK